MKHLWNVLVLLSLMGCHLAADIGASLSAPDIQVATDLQISNGPTPLKGSCKSGFDVHIYSEDGSIDEIVPCENDKYATTVQLSGDEGLKTIYVEYDKKIDRLERNQVAVLYDVTPPASAPSLQGWSGGASNDISDRTVNIDPADSSVVSYKYLLSNTPCAGQLAVLQAQPEKDIEEAVTLNVSSENNYYLCTLLKDNAGNWQTSANQSAVLEIDLTAPVVTVTSPALNEAVESSFTINGSCEDNGNSVAITGGIDNSPVILACVAGSFTGTLQPTGADGGKNLSLQQLDDVGNIGTLSHDVVKDTTAPVITISSPTNNSTIDPVGLSVSGSCTVGDTITLGGTIAEAAQTVTCQSNGTWSAVVNFTQEGEAQTFTVTQTDTLNHSDSETVNLIADPPVFALSGARPALAVRGVACAMCHAKVKGDIVTDFGHGQSYFLGHEAPTVGVQIRPYEAGIYYEDWRDGVQITGNLYTKNASVVLTDYVNALADPSTGNAIPGGGWTLLDVVTKQMYSTARAVLVRLANYIGVAPTDAAPGLFGTAITKNNVLISAPTVAQINALTASMTLVASDSGVSIYKKSTATLTNLNIVSGVGGQRYVRNSGTVECWGDIVIQGTLFLDNLQLNSRAMGCRLHVTGAVFIRDAVNYLNEATYSKVNLQITSARAVIVGFNPNYMFERFSSTVWPKVPSKNYPDDASASGNISAVLNDAARIPDLTNDSGPIMRASYTTYSGGAIATKTPVGILQNQTASTADQAALIAAGTGWAAIPGQEATYNAIRSNCTTDTTLATTNSIPCILEWAQETGRKTVNFKRLLLNAPIIHSRYYGQFKGIVIADFFLPAVQHLEYEYDTTFDSVPVLPLVISNVYNLSD
ncbi:hypothetical protein [Bdellovibrio bacteriovorus]|uniref:hypothetical protein n=1 Tax=Bdellovibrio bacteriovorus TaxID=959 RepID=UPI0035A65DF8